MCHVGVGVQPTWALATRKPSAAGAHRSPSPSTNLKHTCAIRLRWWLGLRGLTRAIALEQSVHLIAARGEIGFIHLGTSIEQRLDDGQVIWL